MPDDAGVLTPDELAAFTPATSIFEPEVMEFPEIGLKVRVRGLQHPRDIAYVSQTASEWSIDNAQARRKLEAALAEIDPDKATVTNNMISTWAWVHAGLVPMFPMEHVARLAARTGGIVERIAMRVMQKSLVMGDVLEMLKNVSGGPRRVTEAPNGSPLPASSSLTVTETV